MRQASSSFPKGPAAPQVAEPSGTQVLCPANGKGELVFGRIKQGRGFRQFLLCGLEKVNGEWLLVCTGRNLLTLFRFGWSAVNLRQSHTPVPRPYAFLHSKGTKRLILRQATRTPCSITARREGTHTLPSRVLKRRFTEGVPSIRTTS